MAYKGEKYIAVYPWIVDLGLTSSEVLTFALIYGFSSGDNEGLSATQEYISSRTGVKLRETVNAINSLIAKGYIQKEKSSNPAYRYKYIALNEEQANMQKLHNQTCKNCTSNMQKLHSEHAKIAQSNMQKLHSEHAKIAQSYTNYKKEYRNKVRNNREANPEQIPNPKSETEKQSKDEKQQYKDFVYLTEKEHQKLVDNYGQTMADDYIERLNNYIGSRGKKYKSHYYTILNWIRTDKDKYPNRFNDSKPQEQETDEIINPFAN